MIEILHNLQSFWNNYSFFLSRNENNFIYQVIPAFYEKRVYNIVNLFQLIRQVYQAETKKRDRKKWLVVLFGDESLSRKTWSKLGGMTGWKIMSGPYNGNV